MSEHERQPIRVIRGGPILVPGPVRIQMEDGSEATSDRFLVAICACGRSRHYPMCDASHRRRSRH